MELNIMVLRIQFYFLSCSLFFYDLWYWSIFFPYLHCFRVKVFLFHSVSVKGHLWSWKIELFLLHKCFWHYWKVTYLLENDLHKANWDKMMLMFWPFGIFMSKPYYKKMLHQLIKNDERHLACCDVNEHIINII